jgi:hypothetical protein
MELIEKLDFPVRGYYHPEACFHTIDEWESIAKIFINLEKKGFDVRGGVIDSNMELVKLINKYFGYQYYIETQHFSDLTQRMVLDFIEDFVNHRVWQMKKEFQAFLIDSKGGSFIDSVKIAYFYSRGNIEPYCLLDTPFTDAVYGNTNHIVTVLHWTTIDGVKNIVQSIKDNQPYAISSFTKQYKKFFRPESNCLIKLQGKLIASFKSDIKSIATDKGNRAVNMYRLGFPEGESSNICRDIDTCKDSNKSTYLWNEIIVKPVKILDAKKIFKY